MRRTTDLTKALIEPVDAPGGASEGPVRREKLACRADEARSGIGFEPAAASADAVSESTANGLFGFWRSTRCAAL
jgi:hypothetical protein